MRQADLDTQIGQHCSTVYSKCLHYCWQCIAGHQWTICLTAVLQVLMVPHLYAACMNGMCAGIPSTPPACAL